jgi:crotonobetainyl-CoA:carnitine CoA-transferase CaiB-like acyl-CoA transferase
MTANQQAHVLSGYKVLDFTQHIAGPAATRLLVEMGAEVIKVELAPDGEPSRRAPYIRGRSGYFIQQNRGKKSLCVDVKKPEGFAILKGLLPRIDVLVENFAPGAIARMGLDYETVKAINPKIVMCSISALGQKGPLAAKPGYDFIGAAYAGILDMNGDPNGSPCFPGMAIGDTSTGVHAVAAIACALLYRERTGKGQYLDISLVDAYFHYHETSVHAYSICVNGRPSGPSRIALQVNSSSPAFPSGFRSSRRCWTLRRRFSVSTTWKFYSTIWGTPRSRSRGLKPAECFVIRTLRSVSSIR